MGCVCVCGLRVSAMMVGLLMSPVLSRSPETKRYWRDMSQIAFASPFPGKNGCTIREGGGGGGPFGLAGRLRSALDFGRDQPPQQADKCLRVTEGGGVE